MKRRTERGAATHIAAGILLLLPIASASAAVVVVPGSLENAEANADNIYPFHIQQDHILSMRYQQVYEATEFSELGPGGGFITDIEFRPDSTSSPGNGARIREIQINLSTTQRGADSLSLVFVENTGGNDTVVYGPGPLVVDDGPPRSWSFWIIMERPFLYDPAQGNLLLEIRNTSPTRFDPYGSPSLDAENEPADSISRLYASSVDAWSGTLDTLGLVTRFSIRPIPEPTPLALGVLGIVVGVLAFGRKVSNGGRGRKSQHTTQTLEGMALWQTKSRSKRP